MHFIVMIRGREFRGGWHKVSSRLQWKKVIKSLRRKIGLKVHTRLYRQKSTWWYWDYSEAQPIELWWNISRLTARFCRPPWIWTLWIPAADWALSQRANAKKWALLTQRNYTIMLSNTVVNQPLITVVCALNNLSPVYHFSRFKSNFCMKQE